MDVMDRLPHKPQLLVVDDDFDVTNILKELLADSNFDVDVAFDGIQALGKIKAKSYDAVLCDYQMPRMNGQALFETLAQSHPQMTSRFIFITGNAKIPEVNQFLVAARVPFLEKPFRSAQVVHLVEKLLQTSSN